MWTIENGLKLVRALQPLTREFNYHLALGGGVLNKGESEKDLDLYFLPMGGFNINGAEQKPNPDGMRKLLDKFWGVGKDISKDYGNEKGYKHAVKYMRNGTQRIDVFIF